MLRAITIDFHDTLFLCDEWFALEVRDLLPRFLAWHAERTGEPPIEPEMAQRAAHHYRKLRDEIIACGIERDAGACVLQVCHDLGVAAAVEDVALGVATLMAETRPSAQPRDGAVELVRAVHAAGLRLAVISNAVYHPFLNWALADHGLDDQFDVVVSSASSGYYKSRPEIYRQTVDLLGVQPEQALHIGDSYRFDVLGAERAGLKTVWLDLAGERSDDHRADLVVDTLEGLAPRILADFSNCSVT